MTDAAELLEYDHRRIDTLLKEALDAANRSDHDAAFDAVNMLWARLAVHIRAEHLRLFPAIKESANTKQNTTETLHKLSSDHDMFMHELARVIKMLRASCCDDETWTAVQTSIEAVAKRLSQHNDIEEAILYPAIEHLDPSVEASLYKELRRELENMPPRFAAEDRMQTDY